jgi:hypothetical protein
MDLKGSDQRELRGIGKFADVSSCMLSDHGTRHTVRGVLGNKCAGQHNLKTVQIREIMWK